MLTLTNMIVFIPMQAIIIGDEKQLSKDNNMTTYLRAFSCLP